jgi:tyrosinase
LVMLTDWDIDKASGDSSCGSMSYCGARDSYPDTRSMGYPFDRPFPTGKTISQTISTQENMAARDITIRWI